MKKTNSPKVVCIIPARKGSKGLYRKNLRFVGCFTLVHRAIRIAKQINGNVQILLNTDDELIIKKYSNKVDICIKRMAELSQDNSKITDVIKNSLEYIQGYNDEDIVMLLEPSSPNRTVADVNYALNEMMSRNCSSLISVSMVDAKFHPFKLFKITNNSYISPYQSDSPIISNRQDIKDNLFYRNGIIYLYKIRIAKAMETTVPVGTYPILIDRHVSNIDNNFDLWIARFLHILKYIKSSKSIINSK